MLDQSAAEEHRRSVATNRRAEVRTSEGEMGRHRYRETDLDAQHDEERQGASRAIVRSRYGHHQPSAEVRWLPVAITKSTNHVAADGLQAFFHAGT